MPDSISGATDTELLAMAFQMFQTMNTNPTNYGLTAALVAPLDAARDGFNTAINDHTDAQANARAKTVAKNASRETLEAVIRDLRNKAKANHTSETLMAGLGLPSAPSTQAPNASVPVAVVDTSERMEHTISWSDRDANGNKRRPRGAMGAEIWVKIGDPAPGDEKDCTFLAVDSATPYVASYSPAEANKTAYYMLRWRMRDGSVGAWGETVSATITA